MALTEDERRKYAREYLRIDRQRRPDYYRVLRGVRNHGPNHAQAFAAFWDAQDGRCYLCKNLLSREEAVIDHDHACCPRTKSCDYCRRGLACHRCNRLIGEVGDDPGLLRQIAGNLEAAADEARKRIVCKPVQTELSGEPGDNITDVRRAVSPPVPRVAPNEDALMALLALLEKGTTIRATAAALGMTNYAAHVWLQQLQIEGRARLVGKGRGASWHLANPARLES